MGGGFFLSSQLDGTSRVSLTSFCQFQSFHFCPCSTTVSTFCLFRFKDFFCLSSSYRLSPAIFFSSPHQAFSFISRSPLALCCHCPSSVGVFITVLSGPTSSPECFKQKLRQTMNKSTSYTYGQGDCSKNIILPFIITRHMPFQWLSFNEARSRRWWGKVWKDEARFKVKVIDFGNTFLLSCRDFDKKTNTAVISVCLYGLLNYYFELRVVTQR